MVVFHKTDWHLHGFIFSTHAHTHSHDDIKQRTATHSALKGPTWTRFQVCIYDTVTRPCVINFLALGGEKKAKTAQN